MEPATYLFIVLLFCGTLLLFAEIFVPGGVLGTVGALALMASIVLAFQRYGTGAGIWVALGVVAYAIFFTVLWLTLMPRMRLGKALTLSGDGKAFRSHDETPAHALPGKTGTTLSTLRPAGIALIEGRRVDVVTDGHFIEKNQSVRVVSAGAGRIVVEETAPPPPATDTSDA